MPSFQGRVTLASVAASAGVSVATVSKVVNGRTDVAPMTRARVQTLLTDHKYVPRRSEPAGRASSSAPTIELIFYGPLTGYSLEILPGVLETAADDGVAVAVSLRKRESGSTKAQRSSSWARDLAVAGRRAVIVVVGDLTVGHITALSQARLPLVVVDPIHLPRTNVTSVGSTNFAGGLAATQHLLGLGHRRIAYLGGPTSAACNQARMHGYRAAMEAHRVHVPDSYVRSGDFRFLDGIEGGTELLALPDPPTAVFAGCDETAAGLIEAARAGGLRIPEDLSIVGYDDTHVAQLTSPSLTTVRQPLQQMGRVALRTALRLANGERLESHHVELATELVVRQSTAPPSRR